MADIVNLNRQRKKRRALEKEKGAEQNRAKFGRTKGEKSRQKAESERRERDLDSHERERD